MLDFGATGVDTEAEESRITLDDCWSIGSCGELDVVTVGSSARSAVESKGAEECWIISMKSSK